MLATEILLPGLGEPETLQVRQRELPALTKDQVMLRVEATGVSFAEQGMRRGRYPGQPPFPFVPGYDLVGSVIELGSDVTEVKIGQRVAAVTKIGGWADHVAWSAKDLIPVPAGVDAIAAVTAVTNGVTAWQMLHRLAKVQAGQTILVDGATSGVGVLLVQLARLAGVQVIGTASSKKLEQLRALGVEPVDYQKEDIVARVRELTPDGVNAVFDNLGGQNARNGWQLLAPGGTLVSYGLASIIDGKGSVWPPMLKHLARIYSWHLFPNGRKAHFYNLWGGHTLQPQKFRRSLQADLTQVFTLMAEGKVKAQVAAVLPLERAAEGLRLLESRTIVGKVVLVPGLV